MLTLLEKVNKYKDIDLRFHTPGQSEKNDDALYQNSKYDITELSFSDNLLYPNGVILDLEKELEKIYNTKRTLVITAGATTGNFIGLNVLKNRGKVLVTSNCHKSIFSAVRLFNIDCVFMDDAYYENGLPRPVTLSDLEKYLTPDIKSVVLTSPTYFGNTVSKDLILSLQKRGLLVMVDEAHGSHFVYSKLLPDSLASVADIVIDSVHKTLPVYTGGALIHINNSEIIAESELYHSLLHTSSPNYVTMCSIDYTQDLFSRKGETLYQQLFDEVKKIKLEKFKVVKTDDFSRLVIDTFPYDGDSVSKELEKNGVYIELSYKHYLVLILTPQNSDKIKRLNSLLLEIEKKEDYKRFKEEAKPMSKVSTKKGAVELIDLDSSLLKVSGSEVGIYPPGVPVLKTGDIITKEQLKYLKNNRDKLFGLVDGKIFVIKEK